MILDIFIIGLAIATVALVVGMFLHLPSESR